MDDLVLIGLLGAESVEVLAQLLEGRLRLEVETVSGPAPCASGVGAATELWCTISDSSRFVSVSLEPPAC